jgi:hypothetical protein
MSSFEQTTGADLTTSISADDVSCDEYPARERNEVLPEEQRLMFANGMEESVLRANSLSA